MEKNFAAPLTDYETFLTNIFGESPINTNQHPLATKEETECLFPIHGRVLNRHEIRNVSLSISTNPNEQSFQNVEIKMESGKCNRETKPKTENNRFKIIPLNHKESHTSFYSCDTNITFAIPPSIPENPNSNDKMSAYNSEVEIVTPQMQSVVADPLTEPEVTLTTVYKMADDNLECDVYYNDLHYQFEPSKELSYDVIDPVSMKTIFRRREQPIQFSQNSEEMNDEYCYDFNHSVPFESNNIVNVKRDFFITCQLETNNDEEMFVKNVATQHSISKLHNVVAKPSPANLDEQDEKNVLLPSSSGIAKDVPPLPQITAEKFNTKFGTFTKDQRKLFIKWLQSPIIANQPLSNKLSSSQLHLLVNPEMSNLSLDTPYSDLVSLSSESNVESELLSDLASPPSDSNVESELLSDLASPSSDSNVESELLSDIGTNFDKPNEALPTARRSKPVKAKTEKEDCSWPLKTKPREEPSLPEKPIPMEGPQKSKVPIKEKTWIDRLREERYRFGLYPFTPIQKKSEASTKLMSQGDNCHGDNNSMHHRRDVIPCQTSSKLYNFVHTKRKKSHRMRHSRQLRKKMDSEKNKSEEQLPCLGNKEAITRFGFRQSNPNVREPVYRQSIIKTNQRRKIQPPTKIKLSPKVEITPPPKLKKDEKAVRKPILNERKPKKNKDVNANIAVKKRKAPRVQLNVPLKQEENNKNQRLDNKKRRPGVGMKGKQRNVKLPPSNKTSKLSMKKKKLKEEAEKVIVLQLEALTKRKEILMKSIKQQETKKLAAHLTFDEIQHQELAINEKLFRKKNVYLCKREDVAHVHNRYLDMKFRIGELNEKMSYLDVKVHKKKFNKALESFQAKKEALKQMGNQRNYQMERLKHQIENRTDRMLMRSEALMKNLKYHERDGRLLYEDFKKKTKLVQETRAMVDSLLRANPTANVGANK